MNRELAWFKSSYSGTQAGDCIEVATGPRAIHIRDSKNEPGPHLTLTPTTWAAFLRYAVDVASVRR
ncbi:DUF397 domain-containing protein [Streptomyces sp. NPDC004296]|uniref:DUF397 domain-containing protein n=1 Tax=Streptomyces sp. NPDC004296 TaxID=3364697 RepID=UPI0036789FC5